MEVFIKEEDEDVWDDSVDDTTIGHDIHDDDNDHELMDSQSVGQSLSSLSSINPYFNWNPKTHYSVIILNDRLMSETLLSDDDNEDDDLNDTDVKSLRNQRTTSSSIASQQPSLTGKRRHNELLTAEEDDSRDSDSDLTTCSSVKSRQRRAIGSCVGNRIRSLTRGHSLETIQALRSHSVDEDIDLDLNFSDVTTNSAQNNSTTTSAATVLSVASPAVVTPSSQSTTSTLAALLNNPCLPPTPPSSQCGSDSENVSFRISEIRRKNAIKGTTTLTTNATQSTPSSTLISIQPKNAIHGSAVILTEEEKRTLVAEGYPIPQRFPLTKSEERSLKKIRRKIKNKISAQESRRKKKEYMEELERRVQHLDSRVRELEKENKFLKQNSK